MRNSTSNTAAPDREWACLSDAQKDTLIRHYETSLQEGRLLKMQAMLHRLHLGYLRDRSPGERRGTDFLYLTLIEDLINIIEIGSMPEGN